MNAENPANDGLEIQVEAPAAEPAKKTTTKKSTGK